MNATESIFHLCEQIESALGQHHPSRYLSDVVAWLNTEWRKLKKKIIDILLYAIQLSEIEEFEPVEQEAALEKIKPLLDGFVAEARERIAITLTDARIAATLQPIEGGLGVLLSREGLQRVLDGLDWQTQFVDDLSLSTLERVQRLMDARYGSLGDLKVQVEHAFRVRRDDLLDGFASDMSKIADSLAGGRIDPARFEERSIETIRTNYRKLYRDGKGSPLTDADRVAIERQVESQRPFLSRFRQEVDRQLAAGEELTGRLAWRANLYANRGTTLYEQGWLASQSSDTLIAWRLGAAEHCAVCPQLAAASPYTPATLPTLPAAGMTPCLSNCKCFLEVYDAVQ